MLLLGGRLLVAAAGVGFALLHVAAALGALAGAAGLFDAAVRAGRAALAALAARSLLGGLIMALKSGRRCRNRRQSES